MENTFYTLQIDKIIENLSKYLKTGSGKKLVSNLECFNSFDQIELGYKRLDDAMRIISIYGDFPFSNNIEIKPLLDNAKKGTYFDEVTINLIKNEILNVKEIIKYFKNVDVEFNFLKKIIEKFEYIDPLYQKIINVISPDNIVMDSASEKLKEARSKIRKLEKEIRKTISSLVSSYKDYLAGENYVLRDGRFVLPINTSYKSFVPGVIHDISDSGQTTFIEPTNIVNFENEKHLNELIEKDEVERILKDLTATILRYSEQLLTNNKTVGILDLLNAKVKYAKEIKGIVPELTKERMFNLKNARHPLLDQQVVVGNDFALNNEKTLMLISGPNAGGKTIALKTVGVIAYLTKLIFPLPIDEGSKVCVFSKIHTIIGDNQSLENNLSTFSSHINDISVVLKSISSRDLVVIDELGTGTDPKEGDALSVSIVEYLLEKGCLSLVSSHFPLLKNFGISNSKILNASFVFDEEKIEPTFKMVSGISGKSYGFLIAQKFGLDKNIINEAKRIYNKNYKTKIDIKIEDLDEKEKDLVKKIAEVDEKLKIQNQKLKEIEAKEKQLLEKEEKLKNKKIDDLDELIDSKIAEIDEIVNDFKEEKNLKVAEEKQKEIANKSLKEQNNEFLAVNDSIIVKSLGISGKIVEIKKNKVSVITEEGLKITVNKDLCEKNYDEKPAKKKISSINIDKQISQDKIVSMSLNLIGLRVDEAIPILEKYLDDCIIKKYKEVTIIHGYGTGQLRNAVHQCLKKNKFVRSFELGGGYDGNSGSTIVKFYE